MKRRIEKVQSHLRLSHRDHQSSRSTIRFPHRLIPAVEMYQALDVEMAQSVFLVAKRPPLTDHPLVWRWLARLVYKRINWAPDYGIEYQGVYEDEATARHAAAMPGGFYIELPLNAELPQETAQFGKHDFPLSDASAEYRNRKFPYITLTREQLEALDAKVTQTLNCANGECVPKVV